MDSDLKSQILARGRHLAKIKFKLTEQDFIELAQCEESYLSGYKYALKTIKNKENGKKERKQEFR